MPKRKYSYQPLHMSFGRLVKRDGFLSSCELWRKRTSNVPDSYLGDVYDGCIWHEFCSEEVGSFLSSPFCDLLTMDVDWFQPFTHTEYSVGAIYLTVQNLPRSERNKDENVILVGIIPGPKELSLSLNSYLSPLVQELKHAWEYGMVLSTCQNATVVRLALGCVTCDIPASKKVSGFLGHNSRLGCNKCLKVFNTSVTYTDYSGCDRENWE